jgi:hypothetical protein
VSIATTTSAEFLLEGRRVVMNEGEAWYLELNRRHSVRNRGRTERHRHDQGLLVNDSELPGVVEARLLGAFGAVASHQDNALMQRATQFNAKNPYMPFESDTEGKERASTGKIREMADR